MKAGRARESFERRGGKEGDGGRIFVQMTGPIRSNVDVCRFSCYFHEWRSVPNQYA